jgi:hypothetical protein
MKFAEKFNVSEKLRMRRRRAAFLICTENGAIALQREAG